jgi:hypothetical protein
MATEGNQIMRTWDQLTALEQAAQLYSDAHKDAYGFRPRNGGVHCPETLEEYEEAIGKCAEVIGEEERREDRNAAIMLLEWESQLAAMRVLGAPDRATAIRWHIQSLGYEGDFATYDCQEVESALYGTYPIRIWGILLSEVWSGYTMCGVRQDLTPAEQEELNKLRANEKKRFMTGYRPTWEELGQAA